MATDDADQPDELPSWFTRHRYLSTTIIVALVVFVAYGCFKFRRGSVEHAARRKASNVYLDLREWCREHDELPPPGTAVASDPEFPVRCLLTGSHFVWKTEPSGQRLTCNLVSGDGERFPGFIACSEKSTWDGRRCFVFVDTEFPEILSDDEVNWTTQMRRSD